MASTSGSQHRCVFVGNIPYDATEEQLIQICEEVGPVVSFRLVLDKETGRPKGYGFCEYKDEETALSARRNLQGYEINGRQLRVDFAENDKGVDRNREQGRGGPGLVLGTDSQKLLPSQPFVVDAALQSLGYPMAAKAASVMAEAIGGLQASSVPMQLHGLPSYHGSGNDSLTIFLAKMSKNQLNEIMLEMKDMATKNRAQAQQLLQESPELTKALFQAQIMLGCATPQLMQMAANRKPFLVQDNKQDLNPVNPPYHGQSSLQKEAAIEPFVRASEAQGKKSLPDPVVFQHASLPPIHVPFHAYRPPLPPNQIIMQGAIPGIAGVVMQPNVQTALSTLPRSSSAQVQPFSMHNAKPAGTKISSLSSQIASLNRPVPSSGLEMLSRERRPFVSALDSASALRIKAEVSSPLLIKQMEMPSEALGALTHLSKRPRLEEGVAAHNLIRGVPFMPGRQAAKADMLRDSQMQMPQISQGDESALLQQLMSLTPEQLRTLPSEQQQQVLEIQRALRSNLLT